MKKHILLCLLSLGLLFLFVSCARTSGETPQITKAPKPSSRPVSESGPPLSDNSSFPGSQPASESASSLSADPPVPELSSFCTVLLAEGDMILPEDRYALAGEELTEFQNALMPGQWRGVDDWQGKGCFLSPCVIVEGNEKGDAMYLSPANADGLFDETLVYIKYGTDQRYNAVYLAPGEVLEKVEALRAEWRESPSRKNV